MTNEVVDFYEKNYSEDERLQRHRLELIRTREIISRYLKSDDRIADIGGAAGVYSLWLAKQGYDVTLFDLTPKHIEAAQEKAASQNIPLACVCGDARSLPFDDDSYDVALNMGPLYHLQERQDRIAALNETYRIIKPGGTAICAVISRYASLLDGFKNSTVDDDKFIDILDEVLLTGRHNSLDTDYFTTSYNHTNDEIISEMTEANFSEIKLIGVEGFASCFNDDVIFKDGRRLKLVLKYLKETESIEELSLSYHVLAVGVKERQ